MLAREQAARLKPYVAGWRRGPEWAKGGMLGKNGDFLLVLPVKKEKKRAPQALAGGRKGTGKG